MQVNTPLQTLVVGAVPDGWLRKQEIRADLEFLLKALKQDPSFQIAGTETCMHHSSSYLWGPRNIDLVLVDPFGPYDTPRSVGHEILMVRLRSPQICFAFLEGDNRIEPRASEFPSELRGRLQHYYRIDKTLAEPELKIAVRDLAGKVYAWRNSAYDAESRPGRREYDVALSFAGEDREYAEALAWQDERARLWGKNLYTFLHQIYSQRASYCIMLISMAYRDKMWTVHERAAAQERTLEERGNEYILPVLLEDVAIPGLPKTISYLPGDLDPSEVAQMFVLKLAGGNS